MFEFIARKKFVITLLAITFTGCVSLPEPEDQPTLDGVQQKYIDGWNMTPSVNHRESNQQMEVVEPGSLPEVLYEAQISLDMTRRVTAKDLALILKEAGIPTMLASSDVSGMSAYLPEYRGSAGSLLQALAASSDLSFSWTGNLLVIEGASQYLLRVPQQESVVGAVSSALSTLGAQEVMASKEAGIVNYRASKRVQSGIEIYLDKMLHNTSVINLQLAVINVKLDDTERRGFDWSSLSAIAGDFAINADIEAPDDVGELYQLTNDSLGLSFARKAVTLQSALNLLSTYGTSQTAQNLTLKTLSGVPVSIRSGTNTPYVDSVNVTTVGESASSGVDTKILETGFMAEVSPFYDAEEQAITLSLNLTLETLIGFRELSAGNQLGTIERPETQDQEFNSTVRLQAGETALVGGLIYESFSDSRTSIQGLEKYPVGSQNTTVTKNAMFILLRPTVTVYGPKQAGGKP